MKSLGKIVLSTALGAGALAVSMGVSAPPASAAIVCNGNTCWHTHESYSYPPEAKVIVHPDEWHWKTEEHYSFREHEGRGYWRDGTWVTW